MFFKPMFELGFFCKKRSGREDKLGGVPFGLPPDRWPACKVCGRQQNYIGQFWNSATVNLGRQGRALFLFQCPDGPLCASWEHSSGANAGVLVDVPDAAHWPTAVPPGVEIEPEGIIVGWEDVSPTPYISYVGPSPSFGLQHQCHGNFPEPDGRFLLQLVGSLDFKAPAPSPAQTGAQHLHYSGGKYGRDNVRVEMPPKERRHYGNWSRGQSDVPGQPSQVIVEENGDWSVECANFGGGTAYVFIDDGGGRAFYFWEP
jgi:hypothetical protein